MRLFVAVPLSEGMNKALVRKMKGKKPLLKVPKEEMAVDQICLMNSVTKDGKITYKKVFSI